MLHGGIMPAKSKNEFIYAGIRGHVVAIRTSDGEIHWSTKLKKGSSFVPIVHDGQKVYAASGGEITCLDAASGDVLWRNPLKGYGTGYVALAGAGFPVSAAAEQAARAAVAAASV
ncbi:MAG: PQQ-binding-like beta-propeller repeat protein [Planctomycetota bacterium]